MLEILDLFRFLFMRVLLVFELGICVWVMLLLRVLDVC